MPANRRPLTDAQVRAAKPRDSAYKLSDGGGLYLLVETSGGRRWRYKYRLAGKERLLALGVYPDVSLGDARERHQAARRLVAAGRDPSSEKQAEKRRAAEAAGDTLEAVAREWIELQRRSLAPKTIEAATRRLEIYVFPRIGRRPIGEIEPPELLDVLRKIEADSSEVAHRVRQRLGQIFRFGISTSRARRDPTADLRDALAPLSGEHFATITEPARVGALLRAIEGYRGFAPTRAALRLAPHVFVRPGELRTAEWAEIDAERREWRIPASKMKMRDPHVVPLSAQSLAIIEELRPITGRGRYLFPSVRTPLRPISENTLGAALRGMGFTPDVIVPHGLRATASTILNELGFSSDAIERQLAHRERSKVRAAYDRGARLDERRALMDAWSSYLGALRDGAQVIPIGAGRGRAS